MGDKAIELLIWLLIFLLGVAFAAGGYVFALQAARKQINGLGARLNRVAAGLLKACPEDKRDEIFALILGLKK
jgi:hypothetical protein